MTIFIKENWKVIRKKIMCAKISDRKGWIHDTEENTLLLVWKREEIQISFKVHKELASVLSRV